MSLILSFCREITCIPSASNGLKKGPKVAYAVFVGRNPGVYSTWSEAEKQVNGFSRPEYRGYTVEEGGRARAERECQDCERKRGRGEGDALGSLCNDTEGSKITSTRPFKEPFRVYVSDCMPQSSTPQHCVLQQLQTPPNTLIGKKRERPPSWEATNDLSKEAICVGDNGTPEAATGLKPHTHVHIVSHTAHSAKISFCNADDCSVEESCSDSEAFSPNCSDVVASDASSDDKSPSDTVSDNTKSNGKSAFGDSVWEAEIRHRVLLPMDSEDNSRASTILFDIGGTVDKAENKIMYPQLPVPEPSSRATLNEVASDDRNLAAFLPNVTLDHFNPALDHSPLGSSSDYGDFLEDPAVLDRITASGQRTEPPLCIEQLALVELIMSGKNVFYTGSAGSGKSTVLKHVVSLLRKEGNKVDILAPTGRAALEVNGRTLHNYAGWVPRSLGQPLRKLENNARGEKVRKRLRATDILIVDEISMVANHVFERLNCIMKSARDSKKPFGGVRMIVTGDFCQLPPVNAFEYCLICGTTLGPVSWEGNYECVKCLAQFSKIDKWAFRSAAWNECDFEHVNLKVIHRQKSADFKALLENSRLGEPRSVDEKWLLLEHPSETRGAVRLFPRRVDVKTINNNKLAQLPGRTLTYLCVDNFYWNRKNDTLGDKKRRCPEPMSHALEALEEHIFEPTLELKEGMLVILLVNWDLDSSLANGSQGTIIGFEKHDPKLFPEVPRDWEYSSRRNGLARQFVKGTAVQEWPIVKFHNGRERTIYPRCMINELGDDEPYSLLSRTQIPLMAAWAMTVHRAQGMTLSRVIVDLRHSFEPGQEYVALSRAETLEGLKVEGLPEKERGPNEQVIEFLKEKNLMPVMDWDERNDAEGEQVKETG